MKTTLVKDTDVQRAWHVIDATDKPVGRLAVVIADILRGKNKPTYAPQSDLGDFVVVINAEKVKLTGAKEDQKEYKHYTGYAGGLKTQTARQVRAKHPEYLITHAVKSMLPKNHLSRQAFTRLKVYAGAEHPHAAQNPQVLEL